MAGGSRPKPGLPPAPKAAHSSVHPYNGASIFVTHGYLIGFVILAGTLVVIVLIYKLFSRTETTPLKSSRDAIEKKSTDFQGDLVNLSSQSSKLLEAKDSLELAKRASRRSDSEFQLAEEYPQADTKAAGSHESEEDAEIITEHHDSGKGEAAEDVKTSDKEAVTLETSETINKEKKRRRSSVGEALKRLWRPKKSAVDTKSTENLSEGSSTDIIPPAEVSKTMSKERATSVIELPHVDQPITANQVEDGIDKTSSREIQKDTSEDRASLAKTSVKFLPHDMEDINIENIEPVDAEVQEQSVQAETSADGLPEPETERRRSSLADAINWLWNQTTVTEAESKTLNVVTEEGSDIDATRMEEIDSHETMKEPVEELVIQESVQAETTPYAMPESETERPSIEKIDSPETTKEPVEDEVQKGIQVETTPDALAESESERRRSSLADAINWLWNQTTATEAESKTLNVVTEEGSDIDATRMEEIDSHETVKEPVEEQESVQAETTPYAMPESETERPSIEKIDSPETTKEPVEAEVQKGIQVETTPDALAESESERRRSSLADAINWLWNQTTATEAESKTLNVVTEEGSDIDATRMEEIDSHETMKEPVEEFEEQVQQSVQPEITPYSMPEPETERPSIEKIDSPKITKEPVEAEVQQSVQAKSTPDALAESESERRSSLADAINWLWNRTTTTEVESKTLEGVTEESVSDAEATEKVDLHETIKQRVEDEGQELQEYVQAETTQVPFPEPETSPSHSTVDRITSLLDHEHRRQSETTEASTDIIHKPAQEDIHKGRRASEPATSLRNSNIPETKRRRSSVGQALKKLWNPKKFQIDSRIEEDSATTSAERGENSERVENEPHDSENYNESTKVSTTEVVSRTSFIEPPQEDKTLTMNQAEDDIEKSPSRGILKHISEARPSSHTIAKPSVKFLDYDLKNISIGKIDSINTTIEVEESVQEITQVDTTSDALSEPKGERQNDIQEDLLKTTIEPTEAEVLEIVQTETTSDGLPEPETEKRRSSLADAINWLWNRATATEDEEPKTLEDVTEESSKTDAVATEEVESHKTNKEPVDDQGEQVQESVQDETTSGTLPEAETSSSSHSTANRITSLPDHEHRQSETTGDSETIVHKPAQEDIHEQGELNLQENLTKGRRASEQETSSQTSNNPETKRRRSSVGQALRKLWNPKKFQIDSQLEEDSATTNARPYAGESSEYVENEPHYSEAKKEPETDVALNSKISETEAGSRKMSTKGSSERRTNANATEKDSIADMSHEQVSDNNDQVEEDHVTHSEGDTESAHNVSEDVAHTEPIGNEDYNGEV